MELKPHEIHVWSQSLVITPAQARVMQIVLSEDERKRAQRFHQEIHQLRFTAARFTLRHILSLYLNIAPQAIVFAYAEHNKPYLPAYPHLQFNVSHSHDIAVYAITLNHAIGIDIEKIGDNKDDLARRFFSPDENALLKSQTDDARVISFYQIWARKEALIKAVGKGLSIPLASFSVAINNHPEIIELENEQWSLHSLHIDPAYQAAFASNQKIDRITYWHLENTEPHLIRQTSF